MPLIFYIYIYTEIQTTKNGKTKLNKSNKRATTDTTTNFVNIYFENIFSINIHALKTIHKYPYTQAAIGYTKYMYGCNAKHAEIIAHVVYM